MNSNREEILRLYFEEKLKQVQIAKILNISKNAVSKTLKMDARYENEKSCRKENNKIKHIKQIQNCVELKRIQHFGKNSIDYYVLKSMHDQASVELSGGIKPISNRAYRDWNTSAFKYNYKSKSYDLRKDIIAGCDIPKRIKWD